jgi:ADP-ribose pyrophosphatase YjhB (NUDIX family)
MVMRDLHHIQKEIILSLAHHSPQRFSQLQPPEVPNNTFSYHLKKLLQSGFVAQVDGGYEATRKALKTLQYNGALDDKSNGNPVYITAVHVTNSDGKVLLLRRSKPPFVGWYCVPAGVVHLGENLEEAALRELSEKSSIEASSLKFNGVLDFQYLEQESGDVFVHTIAFVYSYRLPDNGMMLAGMQSPYGTLLWSDLGGQKILPEVYTIAELIRQKEPTVKSVSYEEPTLDK